MVANLLECELKKLSLANGREFHFVEAGVGPPLVFIHGGAGDYTTWRPQWTDFTRRFRCISYSRRYCSPNQNALVKNHSAVGEAQDLAGLIEAWAASPAMLVGASYGVDAERNLTHLWSEPLKLDQAGTAD